jgi:hypothetical protein
MPSYTFKEGTCAECGSKYKGLICDEEPIRNMCPLHRDKKAAVTNARSIRYFSAQPYFDTGLGTWVKSRRERNNIMRERNLVEVGDYNPKYIMDDIKPNKPWERESDGPDDDFMEVWREVTEPSEQAGAEI